MEPDTVLARSFDAVVDEYEQGRPGYFPGAIARLAEIFSIEPGTPVLDLAAGSGKVSRLLVPTGAAVTAVEPLPGMRARLVATAPSVTAIDGHAEAIPVPDHSQALVVVGSAFHWFDQEPALAEIARVLRPGGGLALLSTREDGDQGPWHDGLDEIVDARVGRTRNPRSVHSTAVFAASPRFGELHEEGFPWPVETTVDQFVARTASYSRVASQPADERAAILAEVRARLERNLAEAGGQSTFTVDYRTRIVWSRVV